MKRVSSVVRRSFYSERMLVEQRATDELWLKYRMALPGVRPRFKRLFDLTPMPETPAIDEDLHVLEAMKNIGHLTVMAGASIANGRDAKNNVAISYGDPDIISLHMNGMLGLQQIRADLGSTAAYLAIHEQLRNSEYVMGTTYSELARFAGRIGFREMNPDREGPMSEQYYYGVVAAHRVFSALNGGDPRSFRLGMVYLPTGEFIDRFSAFTPPEHQPPQPLGGQQVV